MDICKTLAVAVGLCAVAPLATAAEPEVDAQLAEMRDLVQSLRDHVEAQDRVIEEQGRRMEEAGLDDRAGFSALSSFLTSTEFYGWVSATYQNDLHFNDNNDGMIPPAIVPFGGTKPNSFGLNQLWFGMDKPPTEDSRSGFHVDLSYGLISPFNGGTTDTLEIWAAYASYLVPILNGVQIDAGELWTLLGGEVVQTLDNFNITRGNVWALQPVNHVGVIASTNITESLGFAIGAVNDPFSDANVDTDNSKAVTGQISYSGESWYAGVSGIFGSQVGVLGFDNSKDGYGMIDVLLTWDPTESLSLWLNYDYNWFEDTPGAFGFAGEGDDSYVNAIAVAGRLGLTDRMGVATRFEYLDFGLDDISNEDIFSITGTLDYALTDHLTGRAEVRYDDASFATFGNGGAPYAVRENGNVEDDIVLAILEMVYTF